MKMTPNILLTVFFDKALMLLVDYNALQMVIIDIETSGLDAEQNGLLSVGAVDFLSPKSSFYGECRIRKGEKIDDSALAINGFTVDEVHSSSKMSTKQLLSNFDEWLNSRSEKVIAGLHIAAFDVPFINQKAQQCGLAMRLHRRSIDLHSLAYSKMLQLKKVVPLTDGWSVMDSDTVLPFCGLPNEQIPRNALNGARLEAECFSRIIYGRGLFAKYQRYEIPRYLGIKVKV